MKYYLFRDDIFSKWTVVDGLFDREGHLLDHIVKPTFSDVDECCVHLNDNKPLADRLPSIGRHVLLSQRATEVIRSLSLPPIVTQKTVRLSGPQGQKDLPEYTLFYQTEFIDAIDKKNANIKWVNGTILAVREWVLSKPLLPPFDLFQSVGFAWLVSDRLVKIFKKQKFTGSFFTPVRIT